MTTITATIEPDSTTRTDVLVTSPNLDSSFYMRYVVRGKGHQSKANLLARDISGSYKSPQVAIIALDAAMTRWLISPATGELSFCAALLKSEVK